MRDRGLAGRSARRSAGCLVALAVAASLAPVTTGSGHVDFDHVKGNEWWVEVAVAGAAVTAVEAQDTGGEWVVLEKKWWGPYAASFHIEPGHLVRFRASWADGQQVSCWFTHPDGVEQCGSGPSFTAVTGNEWWVQAKVTPASAVDVRLDGGPWMPLERQTWGTDYWAASYHIVEGTIVQLRAGDAVSDCYRWIPAGDAAVVACGRADVAFGPKAGNEWWVETLVVHNGSVTGVQARADGGAWHDLSLRDWGFWAGSFHVPAGSTVEFRAQTDGGTDTSDGFLWPAARPAASDGSWPEEGSYARYATSASDPAPSTTQGTTTLVFHDGAWWALHESETESHGQTHRTVRFCDDASLPEGPTGVAVGDRVDVQVGTCFEGTYDVIVRSQDTYATRQDGQPTTADTWHAQRTADCRCLEWTAEWERSIGLLMHAHQAGRGSAVMDLVDTDAPIGL